ncbi:protein turtle-like isoform X1 [Bombus vosnesenskii]|uniref:Protein turtle-like isoform X1 n=3 Tax=Pyrobombus TaxID=144703 RepID=A0A6J3KZW9_9HYME|nr:protein turtle isoform X1 [Bombus impatiens]XP_033203951.1 protein turtle-like isoform X1 [Bombus vancouverensis nearcticus]XP_033203952.1 protein turtle-like isoform X1 [Bombus vancouverensis nearcticus]XP_033203953.1 protein turtle-like isoform X1 [Bombus vancouverensis nearcticus]XP_033203954.1 protein turtle-like isoform X1 [Bombus vancouverensis nearcticus]XP_033203955.1 protein turtle-like isoform X1 [Bombus vancouverensis nearcticus]XP_033312904.1 protein turtle-like isoform X1 [Bom
MGGGGGLQATDLRRRLESRFSGSACPQRPRSLRHDGSQASEGSTRDQEERVDLQAALASGQPTCTGSRPCRRQANEGNEQEKGSRCSNGGSGVIGKLRLSVARPINTAEKEEGVNGKRHRFRWCRRDIRWIADVATRTLLLGIVLFVTPGLCHQDAVHITAILGESVVFNCHVEFPGEHPVPYVLQWEKKVGDTGQEIPIYIWYESYPTHSGEGYEGRVSRVSPNSPYGVASLNLTDIRESDQGWYECKVVFLNRSPNSHKNGTWFHLDVHVPRVSREDKNDWFVFVAPPKFSITPEEMIYVNVGDAIILNCQAEGTPTPEILWYKDANPVEPSTTIGIFNDGTELRISTIKNEDIGDYTCIARNGEGQISHTARVIIAGGAVITVPPTNQTKLEGEKVQFSCEAKALPGNVTVRWFREGAPVTELSALDTRVSIKPDGSLVINPVSADDSGQYLCEVTNGIGDPQSASAYLNVEYPAKVTFTPTVQYLPFRLAGVVQCYIKANPTLQYVTWTKDKRLLEPYQTKDIVVMNNGSLLFTRVNENHQGRYTCTPYNAQGTQGSSGPMEVLVRNPPVFTLEPEPIYQKKVGETVEMHCDAQEAEGTQKPTIQWHRRDGASIQRNRAKIVGGNLTIESLRRADFGFYQCVASNEVATISASTQLIVEGTQPHAPYNVSGTATEFAVSLTWLPGYSGGPDYKQDYTIWYRESGTSEWKTIPVTPSGSTTVTINSLTPGTLYEFQVIGKNALGDGMLSKLITIRTLDILDHNTLILPTDSTGNPVFPPIMRPKGPKPGPPKNLTVTEVSNGFLISWEAPVERNHLIQYYTIKYKTDGPWKTLNKGQIRPEETSYLVKNLVGGRTYYFQVFANSATNYGASEQVKFPVPARVKHKAITAGVVGGILFFIVAIILSICAVKICNKRKRRKQEKELLSAYSMVACRVTDARNGAGQGPQGTVPLKKPRKSRVPGLNLLREILNPDTPDSCRGRPLGKISRAADGRFVVADSVLSSANNSILDASSSDDGGFLPKQRLKSSWRRPLVGTSQLSLRSDGSGVSIGGLPPSIHHHGTVNSLARIAPAICTISSPRFLASSPSGPQVPWTPLYFSDLSSVRQPSSGERSFPTPPDYLQLRSVHQRYSQELPSLKAIHAESRRFVPVQPLATSSPPQSAGRSRARLPPRHARHARSAPELAASPDLETSPESRSSSSGFGSKNTSQQNQSSRSGSTVAEWRPPPYRPPPPPLVGRWLELQDQAKVEHTHIQNAVDAGSVDGHYEFDPVSCTPTPTSASTPTREERPPVHQIHTIHVPHIHQVHTIHHQTPRYSRDNIEARVQAMKAEFHQFRQRQARRRQSAHLESAC